MTGRQMAAWLGLVAGVAMGVPMSHASAGAPLPDCHSPEAAPASRRVTLLTMLPGDAIWNVFGHNALWISDPDGRHRIFNFGVVNARPDLLRAFVAGDLDYYLRVRDYPEMIRYYSQQRRTIVAQRLALPADAADTLVAYLERESRPENRVYRYHWTDRNCATRIRDLLDEALGGALRARLAGESGLTARHEVLRHLGPHVALWFGWHFAVSASADVPMTEWQLLFMPDRLYAAVDAAVVRGGGRATDAPLVTDRCVLLAGDHPWPARSAPRRDWLLWLLGASLACLLWWLSRRPSPRRRQRWAFVGVVTLVAVPAAVLGGVSLWLWTHSALVGFHANLNLLVANPLALLLPVAVVGVGSRHRGLRMGSQWLLHSLAAAAVLALALAPLVAQPTLGFVGLFAPPLVIAAWRAPRMHARPLSPRLSA